MASKTDALRQTLDRINKETGVKISYSKIYSDVKKIMSKREEDREKLFVEYYKKLSKQMFDVIAEKRSLANSAGKWLDEYISISQYSIITTTAHAKGLVKACCDIIQPGYSEKLEVSPDGLKSIRDWEIQELRSRVTYNELSNSMLKLTPDVVEAEKEYIMDEFEIGKQHVSDRNIRNKTSVKLALFTFDGNYSNAKNVSTALLYVKTHIIREELAKHGRFWHWLNSKKVNMYKEYLTYADSALKRVGFDPKKHGESALEFAKRETLQTFKVDIDHSKDTCKGYINSYETKRIPQISDASDHYKKAEALDKNEKTEFINMLKPYADKYGMDYTRFRKMNAYWKNSATMYDKLRKVEDSYEDATETLFCAIGYMLSSAHSQGKEVNIPDILSDARRITVLSIAHYSPAYNIDGILKDNELMYLYGANDNKIKEIIGYFLEKSATDEQISQYTEQVKTVIDEWRANVESMQKEDKEIAKTYKPPMPRTFTTNEEKIADSILTIGYRPPDVSDKGEIMQHEHIMKTMSEKWFSGDKTHSDGVKEVFLENAKKIAEIKKIAFENKGDVKQAKDMWDESERRLNETFPNYKPKTMDDFEDTRTNLKVELNENKSLDKSKPIAEKIHVKTNEISAP